jgi:hypothetical protein
MRTFNLHKQKPLITVMKKPNHSLILGAYISRLPVKSLESLLNHHKDCMREALCGTASTQDKASRNLCNALNAELGRMLESDLENIAHIIKRETNP